MKGIVEIGEEWIILIYLCISVSQLFLCCCGSPAPPPPLPISLQCLVLLLLPGLLSVWRIKSLDTILAIRGLIPKPGPHLCPDSDTRLHVSKTGIRLALPVRKFRSSLSNYPFPTPTWLNCLH